MIVKVLRVGVRVAVVEVHVPRVARAAGTGGRRPVVAGGDGLKYRIDSGIDTGAVRDGEELPYIGKAPVGVASQREVFAVSDGVYPLGGFDISAVVAVVVLPLQAGLAVGHDALIAAAEAPLRRRKHQRHHQNQ